jgi:hypothetical protein
VNAIPEWVLLHRIQVEPFLGRTGTGPAFGPMVEHPCLAVDSTNVARASNGREATDTVAFYLRPGTGIAVDSRVTYRGRQMVVTSVYTGDGGGLPTPDHVKLTCR